MKAARLGRTPAHDKGASHAIRFPRAIRYTIECTLHEHSIVMKCICDAFRCCAAIFAHKSGAPSVAFRKQIFMRA